MLLATKDDSTKEKVLKVVETDEETGSVVFTTSFAEREALIVVEIDFLEVFEVDREEVPYLPY